MASEHLSGPLRRGLEPLEQRFEERQAWVIGRDLLERCHVGARGLEVVLLERGFGVGDELDDFRWEVRASRRWRVRRDFDGLVLRVEYLEGQGESA
jgi:hypothetical protein